LKSNPKLFKEWVMAKGLAQQCDDLKASKGNYISLGAFFIHSPQEKGGTS
jgi:hypothetical protein